MGLFDRPAPAPATPAASAPAPLRSRLSDAERETLTKLEAVVSQGLNSFAAVGKAMRLIRDKQLYRETAETFEEYVAARWQLSRSYASRLIAAAEVCENLSPIGNTPKTEAVARPLASLPPAAQREAWSEVVEQAPKDHRGEPVVSAEAVAAAVSKRRKTKRSKTKIAKPSRFKVPGATVIVIPNKAFGGDYAGALQAALTKLVSGEQTREAA